MTPVEMDEFDNDKHKHEVLAATMADQLKRIYGELKGVRGFWSLGKVVPAVIDAVERAGKANDWHGIVKKDLAVAIILNLVPLPWGIPRWVAAPVIGYAVEKGVAEFNKRALPRLVSLWRSVASWFGARR